MKLSCTVDKLFDTRVSYDEVLSDCFYYQEHISESCQIIPSGNLINSHKLSDYMLFLTNNMTVKNKTIVDMTMDKKNVI